MRILEGMPIAKHSSRMPRRESQELLSPGFLTAHVQKQMLKMAVVNRNVRSGLLG
jgi:hypothetical protein